MRLFICLITIQILKHFKIDYSGGGLTIILVLAVVIAMWQDFHEFSK